MKVQLLVSEWCAPCDTAEEIWRAVAEEREIRFEVLDMGQPEGREVARRLGIRTIPSVVIDDQLKALGVVSRSAALELVAGAPERKRTALRHVGLVMDTSSRAAVPTTAATSARVPTATNFPSWTATASARGFFGSMVMNSRAV